jgi:hypothetical protein
MDSPPKRSGALAVAPPAPEFKSANARIKLFTLRI